MALKMWVTRLGVAAMLCAAFARAEGTQEDAGSLPLSGETQLLNWLCADQRLSHSTVIIQRLSAAWICT